MTAMSPDSDRLTVNCNPTAKSLPIRAGLRLGLFKARGIDLTLVSTPDSSTQRDGLVRGDFQIVHVAVDNAIFMRDVEHRDVVVIMGGDSGMNELFVQPHIHTIEDLRGGRLVVDAPDTAFALQAYRILGDHGLRRDRDYTVVPVGRGEFRLDFLVGIDFFARTSEIRRTPLNTMMKEMVAIKEMASVLPIESLLVPGLNVVVD